MPPFLETINIADFIPVLNRSLENNKSLIYAKSKKDYRQLVSTLFRKIDNQLVIFSGFPTVNFRK